EQSSGRIAFMQGAYESSVRDLREMHEAGVRIMAGSDVAVINIFPGASLFDELELFVTELGMTPLQALHSATRSPAQWLGLIDTVGTIESGKVADLVLLNSDPLQDINNARDIFGVVVKGRLYDPADLDALLDAVDAMPDQSVNDWLR
ncbi:MAG: amidohydrolase family protein, partial [Gammaproteobacteria bacterium]